MSRYGWVQTQESRDYLRNNERPFNAHLFTVTAPPPEMDPRSHIHIKDQQQLGACSGFSRSTIEELLNYIETGSDAITLSAMYAYLTNQQECNCFGADNGATIAGSVAAAGKEGICEDSLFAYTGKYTKVFPPGSKEQGAQHRIQGHSMLYSYADVFAYLATGKGVVQIGIPVGNNFESCTGTYTADMFKQDMQHPLGGHALAIVGYTARKDAQGRNYLILVNSWGTSWGVNGTCEVEPGCFDIMGQAAKNQNDGSCEVAGMTNLQSYDDNNNIPWATLVA